MAFILLVLVSSFAQDCNKALEDAFGQMFSPVSPDDLSLLLYSTKGPFEMGHYNACLRANQNYYYMKMKIGRVGAVYGLCMPPECSAQETEVGVRSLVGEFDEDTANSMFIKVNSPPEHSLGAMGWLLCVFLALIFIGSFFAFGPFGAFNFYSNFNSLSKSRSLERIGDKSPLDALDAVRTFAMCWIIYGHVIKLRYDLGIINFDEWVDIAKKPWLILGVGAEYAIDTFFWMSGLFAGLLLVSALQDKMYKIYLHRFLRIYPLYLIVGGFNSFILPAMGDGPLWFQVDASTDNCSKYGWSNLFFLNNFIPDGVGNECNPPSYYLCIDVQLFVVATLIVWLYYNAPRYFAWVFNIILIAVSIIVTISLTAEYDFTVLYKSPSNKENDYFHTVYAKPYCRLAPYIVGMGVGFIMHEYFKKERDFFANRTIMLYQNVSFLPLLSFLFGIGIMSFWVWMHIPVYDHILDEDYWSPGQNVLFLSFEKLGFSIGLTLTLMPILLGHMKLIGKFMAAKLFRVFSRLSYGCYLIHSPILLWMIANEDNGVLLNFIGVLRLWTSGMVISWFAAFVLYILIDKPVQNLIKGQKSV